MTFTVSEPLTPQDFECYCELRWRVLRAPWKQPKDQRKKMILNAKAFI